MIIVYISALIAAALHFVFFVLESLLWGTPTVNRIFKLQSEVAGSEAVRTFAFNMGFYNLFLSLGMVSGLTLIHSGRADGVILLAFCSLSMVGAGLVLLLSSGWRRLPAALVQALPPLVCLCALFG